MEAYKDKLRHILSLDFNIEDEKFTVGALMKMDVTEVVQEIMELNKRANEEVSLKEKMENIKKNFNDHKIEIKKYNKPQLGDKIGDKLYMTQKDLENDYVFVEENLIVLKRLFLNPYADVIAKDVGEYLISFQKYLKLLDEIAVFQNHWLSSENLIHNSDFIKDFPSGEFKKVSSLDNDYKKIMKLLKEAGQLSKVITLMNKTLEPLKKLNKEYDGVVYEAIFKFVNNKKIEYPKFYLFSTEELLEAFSTNNYMEFLNKYIHKLILKIKRIDSVLESDEAKLTSYDNEVFNIKLSKTKIILKEILEAIDESIADKISLGFRVNYL